MRFRSTLLLGAALALVGAPALMLAPTTPAQADDCDVMQLANAQDYGIAGHNNVMTIAFTYRVDYRGATPRNYGDDLRQVSTTLDDVLNAPRAGTLTYMMVVSYGGMGKQHPQGPSMDLSAALKQAMMQGTNTLGDSGATHVTSYDFGSYMDMLNSGIYRLGGHDFDGNPLMKWSTPVSLYLGTPALNRAHLGSEQLTTGRLLYDWAGSKSNLVPISYVFGAADMNAFGAYDWKTDQQ